MNNEITNPLGRERPGTVLFSVSDTQPKIVLPDDYTRNTRLAAALAALGIMPDTRRPFTTVCGDGISNLRVTWYFAPKSICGRYSTAEMMRAWEDPLFHERNPEHPLAYLKVAFENHARLVDLIKSNVPLAMIKRRGKIAFLRVDAPDSTQSKIFKLL